MAVQTPALTRSADDTFEQIAIMAADIFGAAIAVVSLTDRQRSWFAAHGLERVRAEIEPFLPSPPVPLHPFQIRDARVDPRGADHPLVRAMPELRFLAVAPVVVGGCGLGTLTVADRKRLRTDAHQLQLLAGLGSLAARMVQLKAGAAGSERARLAREEAGARDAGDRAQRLNDAGFVVPDQARPVHCQLGGQPGCEAAAELKVADSWGDSAWGCWDHAEDAIRQIPSVFLAQPGGPSLETYRTRTQS